MYDDVPIVPNLYEAPSNPQAKDCYYNITVDKYYIYDGTQGLEAKSENDPSVTQDIFELKYSLDGGATITTLQYTDFEELRTALNSSPINEASYIGIVLLSYPAILIPRSDNTSIDGVALLKLKSVSASKKREIFQLEYYVNNILHKETYGDFDALEDQMNSSALNNATSIEVSMCEIDEPYAGDENENTITKTFVLQYSKNGGDDYITETYDNFTDLTDRTHSSVMNGVTDIRVYLKITDSSIVGKIYPKIIFNQQIIKQLKVNNTDVPQGIFDNVLIFYKMPYYKLSGTDTSSEEHSITFSNYNDLRKYIKDSIAPGSMVDVSIEEVSEE